MPIAIEKAITIHFARSRSSRSRILPDGYGLDEPVSFDPNNYFRQGPEEARWLNYVFGVMAGYQNEGLVIPTFDALITSDLPAGAGLSSSAALEMAVAMLIEQLSGCQKNVVERALICQKAEHEWAGVPCGIMDQFASGAGKVGQVLHLDCRNLSYDYVPLPERISVLTADTQVKHALSDGEYLQRRKSCEQAAEILGIQSFRDATIEQVEAARERLGELLYLRARHVVGEMHRVESFADALRNDQVDRIAKLMRKSHESLRDDFEVSCEELDVLVEAAYEFGTDKGLIGSRMTGGGFGGSTVSLVKREAADALKDHLEKSFQEKFGRALNCFITSPENGAHCESL
jgi:galactokinase